MSRKSDQPLTEAELRELHRVERARALAKTREQQARAGDRAIALQRKIETRRENEWLASATAEDERLAQGRGETIERQGKLGQRVRPSTLIRLHRGGLVTDEEFAALVRYGSTWIRLYGQGLYRSNLKDGQSGGGRGDLDPHDARLSDLLSLTRARGLDEDLHGRIVDEGLRGDARMIQLCDAICGQNKTLKEAIGTDTRKRRRQWPLFKTAAGLLALHYGYLKTREDELKAA